MKKIICLFFAIAMIFSLVACSGNEELPDTGEPYTIKFSQNDNLRKYDGKQVEISGFMSLLSPLDGKLIYLMNMPLQNCPYCIPNSNQLTNTITVIGENIEFTPNPVKVTGTLAFGNFSDSYGYEYSYCIKDAKIELLDANEISENIRVYYTLVENGYIDNLYFALLDIDAIVAYEAYGYTFEQIKDMRPFINDYDNMLATVKELNKKGEYNKFIKALENTKSLCDEMRTLMDNGEFNKVEKLSNKVGNAFNAFFEFVNEYEM